MPGRVAEPRDDALLVRERGRREHGEHVPATVVEQAGREHEVHVHGLREPPVVLRAVRIDGVTVLFPRPSPSPDTQSNTAMLTVDDLHGAANAMRRRSASDATSQATTRTRPGSAIGLATPPRRESPRPQW